MEYDPPVLNMDNLEGKKQLYIYAMFEWRRTTGELREGMGEVYAMFVKECFGWEGEEFERIRRGKIPFQTPHFYFFQTGGI